ncbi:MAG: hypothetical protein AB7O24_18730 [Kofleriaceae bacterium]
MRARTGLIVLVTAAASPAWAVEHGMKVGEVLLSNNGSTTSQYIELQDPGESFPNDPYSLEFYDGAGNSIGSQSFDVASTTTRMVFATAQAMTDFSLTPNGTLTVALPASGQACFKQSSTMIHCLSWGTITSAVQGMYGTQTGASPPDGMSLQRVSNQYVVAAPTPGQPNMGQPMIVDGPPDAGIDAMSGDGGDDDGGCRCGVSSPASLLGGLAVFAMVGAGLTRRSRR